MSKQLEEEKKLVVVTLKLPNIVFMGGFHQYYLSYEHPWERTKWDPQDNKVGRRFWDDIWENMDYEMTAIYLEHVSDLAPPQITNYNIVYNSRWPVHTARPKICWKALIKTLQEIAKITRQTIKLSWP